MPFKKGHSGNPGGRSKKVGALVEQAREVCPEAIKTAVDIMRSADSDRDRLAAAVFLRDTGMGRPSQVEFDIAQVSDEDLWKEVERRRDAAAARQASTGVGEATLNTQ